MSATTTTTTPEPTPTTSKIIKYKCSLCFYDAFNKENLEKHIKKTKKCNEAHIIEIEIKCDFCDKPFSTEISKINHEKICKTKKLEEELAELSIEEQNELLKKKYFDQNKHVELIEKHLRSLKYKFAREEEVNNIAMYNEHGLNANELRNYCVYTLKRLFEELTLPAVTTNLDLMKLREAHKQLLKGQKSEEEDTTKSELDNKDKDNKDKDNKDKDNKDNKDNKDKKPKSKKTEAKQ